MSQIAFIGLGSMGMGMAQCLVKAGNDVVGFDINPAARAEFVKAGGREATSARAAVDGSAVVYLMVISAAQIDSIIFGGEEPAMTSLQPGASLAICATVSPRYPLILQDRLKQLGVQVVDCPVSGGTIRAFNGTLKIFVSQLDATSEGTLLRQNLDAMAEKLEIVPGGIGAGTKLKLINQQLAGIHIAAAAEVLALTITLGLDPQRVLDAVTQSESSSWMFANRVPHIINCDWTPKSALAIFVKDMDIVTSAAANASLSVPLSSIAQQMYTLGTLQGYTYEDDSGIVRVYLPRSSSAQFDGIEEDEDRSKTDALLAALLGIHIVAAAEAFSLAESIGLDRSLVYGGIKGAAGSSVAFETMGSTLQGETTVCPDLRAVTAGLDDFVSICESCRMPAFLSITARQTLRGLSREITGRGYLTTMFGFASTVDT